MWGVAQPACRTATQRRLWSPKPSPRCSACRSFTRTVPTVASVRLPSSRPMASESCATPATAAQVPGKARKSPCGPRASTKGFVVQAKRWVVERTHAWNERARRLTMHNDRSIWAPVAWVWLAEARIPATRSLSGFGIVGCETASAVHFLPAFCPIAGLWCVFRSIVTDRFGDVTDDVLKAA